MGKRSLNTVKLPPRSSRERRGLVRELVHGLLSDWVQVTCQFTSRSRLTQLVGTMSLAKLPDELLVHILMIYVYDALEDLPLSYLAGNCERLIKEHAPPGHLEITAQGGCRSTIALINFGARAGYRLENVCTRKCTSTTTCPEMKVSTSHLMTAISAVACTNKRLRAVMLTASKPVFDLTCSQHELTLPYHDNRLEEWGNLQLQLRLLTCQDLLNDRKFLYDASIINLASHIVCRIQHCLVDLDYLIERLRALDRNLWQGSILSGYTQGQSDFKSATELLNGVREMLRRDKRGWSDVDVASKLDFLFNLGV